MYGRKGRMITSVVLLLKSWNWPGTRFDSGRWPGRAAWCPGLVLATWPAGPAQGPTHLGQTIGQGPRVSSGTSSSPAKGSFSSGRSSLSLKNKQTNLWVRLQWQPSLFLGHFCLLQRKVCFQISMYMISYLRELRGNLYVLCAPSRHRWSQKIAQERGNRFSHDNKNTELLTRGD